MGTLLEFLLVGAVVFLVGIWLKRARDRSSGAATDLPSANNLEIGSSPSRRVLLKSQPQPKSSATARSASETLVAEMQQQAKDRDDRHKAELRSHVERKIPPITGGGREAIERAQQARIAIKHVFPPRHPQRSMSYFGGLPIVPEDFDWPTLHNREGLLERLNFIAQIDCSDLPAGPARDLLPKKGFLYFFAPMSLSFGPDAMHFVARYKPGPVTKTWTPLDMPFTGKIASDDPLDEAWRGTRTHYDRFEIEFGWITEPGDEEVARRAAEGHAFEVADRIRAEKLDQFFGPPLPAGPLLSARRAPKDQLWIPYPGFPANWRTARILRRLVEGYYNEERAEVAGRLKALGQARKDDPEVQRLGALQNELNRFSMTMSNAFFPTINAGIKEHAAPPEETKDQIVHFLDQLQINGMPSSKERLHHQRLPNVINQWIAFAALHGAEHGLTEADGAGLIGPDVVAALAPRHAARKHQMFGLGEVVQVAAEDMKDRYLLLLQLGPDQALNWTVGEMGPLQYWITPEDLAARRFENTVLTMEAY